ncbi:tetraacyldisaccharide 4'-kinase [Flavobacterium oreochromis]|uniref:Tetraacyldisaccharide 4'-kinase n=1 Tax=Flavobacterium oreochromis TaxID=2906078 RepID=A0ABW8P8Z3_9FLAO|nr:tetraacyldisaccharide 4'-kinase [Flavobacterium oreochromis]OWP75900.1 tetraacyldisaccharide 4'-kinase [Flavobacterium oreochromis]
MKTLRKLLFPFSLLYGLITNIRNYLYDKGFLKSYNFDIPIIAVGNLSVGGTGKTPQIEYLVRLLSDRYKVATLSRGYKRKSEGFILANENVTSEILGDEPYQFFQKFPNIKVAVDANRKEGIKKLLSLQDQPEVILLDDAFQHRKVKAGFYIMLSSYDDLFYNDCMLPTGNLRENKKGATRADMIIITKCPEEINEIAKDKIIEKVKKFSKKATPIYFSYIGYDEKVFNEKGAINILSLEQDCLVISGIAKPEPFFNFLKVKKENQMVFSDHHNFIASDLKTILNRASGRKIITTEKDYVRLKGKLPNEQLYYLPIKSILSKENILFESEILNYVGKSTRNR